MKLAEIPKQTPLTGNPGRLLAEHRFPQACAVSDGCHAERREAAEKIAAALVCLSEDKPCGVCSGCMKAKAGSHPDITVIESANKSKSISVDSVRFARQDSAILPSEAENKVYVFTDPLTSQAQNALLKILEEPPSSVCFVLLCDTPESLLPTVQSRITPFSAGNILGRFGQAGQTAARQAAVQQAAEKFLELALKPLEADLLIFASGLKTDRDWLRQFFEAVAEVLRGVLLCKHEAAPGGGSPAFSFQLASLQCVSLMELTIETTAALATNVGQGLLLTRYCARFRKNCGL